MRDKELYARILGVTDPWQVTDVELDIPAGEVRVKVEANPSATLKCPQCGKPCGRYDSTQRTWRHLDTCQYKTLLIAQVPRVKCSEHAVHQVVVPWSEPGSRFTALMEAVVIDWLKSMASIQAVSKQLRMSWDEVDTIVKRAVQRGLLRRKKVDLHHLGVDETSFQKRHEYVTLVTDAERSVVVYVGDDRSQDTLDAFFQGLIPEQLSSIESVSMDMWQPYIASTLAHVPDAMDKAAFDKFHVASHLGKAVDEVRREEHQELIREGNFTLKGSRYASLGNPNKLKPLLANALDVLRNLKLRTARAWHLKETAKEIWHYVRKGWGRQAWLQWISWAMRSRLEPMKKVAGMIREHLWGILNAMHLQVTNAVAESMNAKVQRIKRAACGFRNRERFRNAILFHLGGLDLYPAGVSGTHSNA